MITAINRIFLLLIAIASSTSAAPRAVQTRDDTSCLDAETATRLFDDWSALFKHRADAGNLLTSDYQGFSASHVSLSKYCVQNGGSQEVGSPTAPVYADLDSFKRSLPQNATTMNPTIAHSCDTITAHFGVVVEDNSTNLAPGIVVMNTVLTPGDGNRLVDTTFFEFDAYTWIANLQDANNCVNPHNVLGNSGSIGHIV